VKDLAKKRNLTLNLDPADMTMQQAAGTPFACESLQSIGLARTVQVSYVVFVLLILKFAHIEATHWIDTTKAMFNLK